MRNRNSATEHLVTRGELRRDRNCSRQHPEIGITGIKRQLRLNTPRDRVVVTIAGPVVRFEDADPLVNRLKTCYFVPKTIKYRSCRGRFIPASSCHAHARGHRI